MDYRQSDSGSSRCNGRRKLSEMLNLEDHRAMTLHTVVGVWNVQVEVVFELGMEAGRIQIVVKRTWLELLSRRCLEMDYLGLRFRFHREVRNGSMIPMTPFSQLYFVSIP